MTIKEIKEVLKGSIKDNWVVFEDPTDKQYILKILKEEDLDFVFDELEIVSYIQGKEFVDELREEYESL